MKKTIASFALIMSAANAHAFVGPHPGGSGDEPQEARTICLSVYDQGRSAGDCDESMKNGMYGKRLNRQGCAAGQVSIQSTTMQIRSCPAAMQL